MRLHSGAQADPGPPPQLLLVHNANRRPQRKRTTSQRRERPTPLTPLEIIADRNAATELDRVIAAYTVAVAG